MPSTIDRKALQVFVTMPVTQDMIHKIVVSTLQVLPCKDTKQKYTANGETKQLPSLMTFLTKLVRYTNVYTGTLMATLVYLDKLKHRLPKSAQGLPCTRHRILLSCLILSSKFHNDSSPKNHHWAKYTDGLFTAKDVNLMERQLLYLLNWDLKVDNDAMIEQLGTFLEPIRCDLVKAAKMKKYLERQKKEMEEAALRLSHYRKSSGSFNSGSLQSSPCRSSSTSPSHTRSSSYVTSPPRSSSYVTSPPRSSYATSPSSYATPSHVRSASYMSTSSSNMSLSSNLSTPSSVSSPVCKVDPFIEACAASEEQKLQQLLSSFSRNYVHAQ